MAEPRLILDSGALSALAAGEPRAVAWAYRATQRGMLYGIPAPVLAETLTGRPEDAAIHRIISSNAFVLETTRHIAEGAGVLRYRSRQPDLTIDALVVATAAEYPHSIVLTSDQRDVARLAAYRADASLAIRSVNAPLPKTPQRSTRRPKKRG